MNYSRQDESKLLPRSCTQLRYELSVQLTVLESGSRPTVQTKFRNFACCLEQKAISRRYACLEEMQSNKYTSSILSTGMSDYRCLQPDDALEEHPTLGRVGRFCEHAHAALHYRSSCWKSLNPRQLNVMASFGNASRYPQTYLTQKQKRLFPKSTALCCVYNPDLERII